MSKETQKQKQRVAIHITKDADFAEKEKLVLKSEDKKRKPFIEELYTHCINSKYNLLK